MRIVPGRIVPLGYGKYFRSDRIIGLEPIEEGRGPGRRTFVYVDNVPEPVIASRSETAMLRDMVQESTESTSETPELRQLAADILDSVDRLDPMLRSIVRDQAGWNLDRLEERIADILGDED